MTEKLYWVDAYLRSFEAKIIKCSKDEIILDKTAFYPGGGGQPNDKGTLVINNTIYNVIDVFTKENDIIHKIDKEIDVNPGIEVKGEINWNNRYMYMRYHSALHIIDAIIVTKHASEGQSCGSQIYSDKARIDFDMQALNKETTEQIIKDANAIINDGRNIFAKELSSADAKKIPGLSRTEPGRRLLDMLDTIRVIEIENLDMQADGGTHVKNSKEVGNIKLLKFENNGKHNKRIYLVLE